MTNKPTKPKAPEELKDTELDTVQGAGAKNTIGNDSGISRTGIKAPQPKSMERVFEDE